MNSNFEYIVLGIGGIGSATIYQLARRAGSNVLGLEQFRLGHDHGGSQDHSRIIRLAYHHENYTRLLPEAYAVWQEVEKDSGIQLLTKTGGVDLALRGSPHQHWIELYAQAMDGAGITYERLDNEELTRRYPQFQLDQEVDAVFQADTSIVGAAKANATHAALARYYGATILDDCDVRALKPIENGVEVDAAHGKFTCRKLIITAGSWTDQILASVDVNLGITVTQQQVTYYATPNVREFTVERFPFFTWHGEEMLYGFPIFEEVATKIGIDNPGPVVTTQTRTYEPDRAQEHRIESWLQEYIPGFLGPKLYTKTCLYDMPRDRNFVIDALPDYPQILVCAGAGHAFKFAALLGKVLCELAIDGHTDYPIAPFTLQRAAITDPDYPVEFRI